MGEIGCTAESIIVVGAGIGGLATAVAIHKACPFLHAPIFNLLALFSTVTV